ncbi:hypothetical protein BH10ACI4_BH10ACI4_37220 [soil metagenome]
MRQMNRFRRILVKSTLLLLLLPATMQNKVQAEAADGNSLTSIAEQYLFAAANQERLARGLQPLKRDPVLSRAAAYHALQMAERGDISHGFPGEPELAARAATAGVHFSLITENVAQAPDSELIHHMWMESEGHRENLLDSNVNVAGIAVVERGDQLYAVEDFASTVETLTIDQQESSVATLIATSGIPVANQLTSDAAVEATRAARQSCAASTSSVSGRHPGFMMRYTASTLNKLPTPLQNHIGSGKYHQAAVGACLASDASPFTSYNIAVLLYP